MVENKVIIISGKKGEGKTTKLQDIVAALKTEHIIIMGFTSTASFINGVRNTYSLVDVNTNESIVLSTAIPNTKYLQIGKFYFNPIALKKGYELLSRSNDSTLVSIIDEIGPFELQNSIWHSSLNMLLKYTNNTIIIVVREKLVVEVVNKFSIKNYTVFNLSTDNNTIINEIKLSLR